MKVLRDTLRAFTLLALVATIVAFFFQFVTVNYSTGTVVLTGSQILFGDKNFVLQTHETVVLYQSLRYIVVTMLIVITIVCAAFSFKNAKAAFATLGFGMVSAIMFGYYAFSSASSYIDTRGIATWPSTFKAYPSLFNGRYLINVTYTPTVLIIFILLILAVVTCIVSILVADKVEVAATGELSLIEKIGKFIRDYKNEIKKIVWPSKEKVTRNSITVFAMTIIFGIFIVLVDLGLGQAVQAILNLSK